jgi:arginyl-tRNA--protein-N-Asp/Glu arginylyltransferase
MEAQQEIKKEPEENNSYEESNTSESEDDSDLESIQRFT